MSKTKKNTIPEARPNRRIRIVPHPTTDAGRSALGSEK